MVSQTAHTKKLCEPFMAHLENLYNIPFDAPGTIIFFFGICLRVGGGGGFVCYDAMLLNSLTGMRTIIFLIVDCTPHSVRGYNLLVPLEGGTTGVEPPGWYYLPLQRLLSALCLT